MCKALMTGHDGSMTTIHAEDAELALDQAVQYVMENQRFTGNEKMAKRVVEHAIHLVVHLANQDGRRRVTGVLAVERGGNHKWIYRQVDGGGWQRMTELVGNLNRLGPRLRGTFATTRSRRREARRRSGCRRCSSSDCSWCIACAAGAAAAILDLDMRALRTTSPARGRFVERERDLAANLGWSVADMGERARGAGRRRHRARAAVADLDPASSSARWWARSAFASRSPVAPQAGGCASSAPSSDGCAIFATAWRWATSRSTPRSRRSAATRGPTSSTSSPRWREAARWSTTSSPSGVRARSPVVEYACAVLLWTRSRSLDALIDAIDQLLLPVGEAQLAVQEEASVTLTQQRAVTMAMSVLMLVMFADRRACRQLPALLPVAAGQPGARARRRCSSPCWSRLLGVIVRVRSWTRWDLRRLAAEQERLGAQ